MPGRWMGDHVVVPPGGEASRLHSKGNHGQPLSGGGLRLGLVETAYLVESGRLHVDDDSGPVPIARVLEAGAAQDVAFPVAYLAYRELRERGYLLSVAPAAKQKQQTHFLAWGRGQAPRRDEPEIRVTAWSERAMAATDRLLALADQAARSGKVHLLCLVDEEGDLTHYRLSLEEPTGTQQDPEGVSCSGTLLADRVVVWDDDASKTLHGTGFYGKPVAGGLQLSLVEALHLGRNGALAVREPGSAKPLSKTAFVRRAKSIEPGIEDRLRVLGDLRKRGLTAKTGFKFGTHFRAYDAEPRGHHAPYLVHVVRRGQELAWPTISRAVRLGHSVRKKMLLAVLDGKAVRYVQLARDRP